MPFDKETAAVAGRKRWGDKDPTTNRTIQAAIWLSPDERDMINSKAKRAGVSRGELIVRAVREYEPESGEIEK